LCWWLRGQFLYFSQMQCTHIFLANFKYFFSKILINCSYFSCLWFSQKYAYADSNIDLLILILCILLIFVNIETLKYLGHLNKHQTTICHILIIFVFLSVPLRIFLGQLFINRLNTLNNSEKKFTNESGNSKLDLNLSVHVAAWGRQLIDYPEHLIYIYESSLLYFLTRVHVLLCK